jgi:hypothetical protein
MLRRCEGRLDPAALVVPGDRPIPAEPTDGPAARRGPRCTAWREYRFSDYDRVLTEAFAEGRRLYSAAYVIPPPRLGETRKHRNHLRLIEAMMTGGVPERLREADSTSR